MFYYILLLGTGHMDDISICLCVAQRLHLKFTALMARKRKSGVRLQPRRVGKPRRRRGPKPMKQTKTEKEKEDKKEKKRKVAEEMWHELLKETQEKFPDDFVVECSILQPQA